MTTGKTLALTRQTFFNKVMALLFNMPSRLVITSWSLLEFEQILGDGEGQRSMVGYSPWGRKESDRTE